MTTEIRFEKRCPACGETKPITEFGPNASQPDGRQNYCPPCHSASVRRARERAKARYEAELAKLSPEDRARLGR